MKNLSTVNTLVNNAFKNSSYYAAQTNQTVGAAKSSWAEHEFWITRILKTNMSSSIFATEFAKTYAQRNIVGGAIKPYYIAQTFYVDVKTYPNGIYLHSAELFFGYIDPAVKNGINVTIEIRPTVNGFPATDEYVYPGSRVKHIGLQLNTADLATNTSLPISTEFKFQHPLYLEPGIHSLVIYSNSSLVKLFVSETGAKQLNSSNIVSNPYIGNVFKSDQGDTWDLDSNKDLCFELNRCKFKTGTATAQFKTSNQKTFAQFDSVCLKGTIHDFGDATDFQFSLKAFNDSIDNTSTAYTTESIELEKNINLSVRKSLNMDTSGAYLLAQLTNKSDHITPMIDLDTLALIMNKNEVLPYTTTNSNKELLPASFGTSRYITKTVELQEGFDSNGLTVYVDVNRPRNTEIEIFYKVQNRYDFNVDKFEDRPWVKLSRVDPNNQGTVYSTASIYNEELYQNSAITYTANSIAYTDFNKYAIKICMYSSNGVTIPKIRNLRVITSLPLS